MLRHFLYLDNDQLDQYVSQVEDGLRQSVSRLNSTEKSKGGKVDVKLAAANAGTTNQEQSDAAFADTPAARFERLTSLVSGNEDQFGWVEILQESDLQGVRSGNLIDVTAEIYEPEIVAAFGAKGLMSALPLVKALSAGMGGPGLTNMPKPEQLDAMAQFSAAMPEGLLQGDVVDSDWTIIGRLSASGNPKDIEGDARVVGKVTKVWGTGQWRPIPGLPVVSNFSRQQKREYERKGPDEGSRMMWIEGPAIELDILAVYR